MSARATFRPGPALPRPLLRRQWTAARWQDILERGDGPAAAVPLPGNIRELESTVARAALSSPGRSIRGTDVEFLHAAEPSPDAARQRLPSLADAERTHIVRVLEAVNWNKKQAAGVLEISRGTLYRKIVEYGLENDQSASKAANKMPPMNPWPVTDADRRLLLNSVSLGLETNKTITSR